MKSKTIIAGLVALAFVAGSIMASGMAYASGDKNGKPFEALWDAIHNLEVGLAEIELTPGPPGQDGADASAGEVFVKWGSTGATDGNSVLYTGVAMNNHSTSPGGAGDTICVDSDPEVAGDAVRSGGANLFGGVTQIPSTAQISESEIPDQSVIKCVVLFSETPVLHIWGKSTGPAGWFKAYSGYAMASHSDIVGGGERICVDSENFEDTPHVNDSGALFYPTEFDNPTLIGLPGELDHRELTCSVFLKNP